MKKEKIYSQLINVEGLIYFSIEKPIKCSSKDSSPIFFNFKRLLNYPDIRAIISSELLKLVDGNIDCICGLESGGNYYASYIAEKLDKPLIFLRKTKKKFKNCNDDERIVGAAPCNGSSIALIDDVFATAVTTKEAIEYFKKFNIHCKIYTIFSYGFNKTLGQKLGIEIESLIIYKDLINYANINGFLDGNDVRSITQHINKYDKYI